MKTMQNIVYAIMWAMRPHYAYTRRCRQAKKQTATYDWNSELAIFIEVSLIRFKIF